MQPPEGLVPPPMKNEVPCTLHILIVNPPDDDKLVDLGSLYGDEDMGNLTHIPKLWAHTSISYASTSITYDDPSTKTISTT